MNTTTRSSIDQNTLPRGTRIAAYFVDVTIYWIIDIFTLIPVIGALVDFVLLFYMLFRDVTGASLGKRILGLCVVDAATGLPASTGRCIARNLFFALPLMVGWIPCLGFFISSGFLLLIGVIELAMLLGTGKRLGDRLAGTIVLRK